MLIAGELGQGGAQEEGEKGEESERSRSPTAARAEVVRGGLATTACGRRPGVTAAVKGRGKSERGPRGFYPLPRLGLGRSGGELSAEAGGGGQRSLRRRRCRAKEES